MSSVEAIWVVGTGGHAGVVAALADAVGLHVCGLIDPVGDAPDQRFGLTVVRGYETLAGLERPAVAVAIGRNETRRLATTELRARTPSVVIPPLVHPSAAIERGVEIAAGAHVCIGTVLAVRTRIGEGAIVNSGAIIDHDSRVGPFAHVAPGTRLAGAVTVGAGAFVGIGASVVPGVKIGERATVGAGAVVLEDVPPGVTVVGAPARRVRTEPRS